MIPFAGHPAVVTVTPSGHQLVTLTAITWAQATGAKLYFAYVDPSRAVVEEFPDGSVRHEDAYIDLTPSEAWRTKQDQCIAFLHETVDPSGVEWEFRYLAGRPDRALTHLARAVDAAVFIVGAHTRASDRRQKLRDFITTSLSVQLTHHQHRPVLAVPLNVVDWETPLAAD